MTRGPDGDEGRVKELVIEALESGRSPDEVCVESPQLLAAVRRLSPSKTIERKLLYENARRVFRLG